MTIKKIAQKADVSVATVDRVIHNRGYVSKDKRALIEKIIEDSDYKPNLYARNLKLNQTVRVGFLTPNLSSENGYWEFVYKGVQKAYEELKDESFLVETYEYDRDIPNSFTKAAEEMVASEPNGCVIIPKNGPEAKAFLAKNPDLIYVLVDTPVISATPLCTIGQNFYRGGILAGRLVSLLQPNIQKIFTFSFKNSFASKERIRGFKAFYRNQCDILDLSIKNLADLPGAIREIVHLNQDINAIFIPCSAGFVVGNEIMEMGFKDRIKIVSYDLLPENITALTNGTIDCIISQRPVYQGYASIFQIYRALVKRAVINPIIEVNVDIVFQENIPNTFNVNEEGNINSYCIPSYL